MSNKHSSKMRPPDLSPRPPRLTLNLFKSDRNPKFIKPLNDPHVPICPRVLQLGKSSSQRIVVLRNEVAKQMHSGPTGGRKTKRAQVINVTRDLNTGDNFHPEAISYGNSLGTTTVVVMIGDRDSTQASRSSFINQLGG